jgi:hypothetical protein
MLSPSLPRSLADLLIVFRPCFTAPTFATFRAMVAGFLAQPGLRTVTGMLAGARLAGCGITPVRTGSFRPRAGPPTRSAWCCWT